MSYLLVSTCFGELPLDCIGYIIFMYKTTFVMYEHSKMDCFISRPIRQAYFVLIQMNFMNACCLLICFFELLE